MPNSKLHWQQPHLGSLHNGKTHAQSVTACTSCITKEANFTIHALVTIDLFVTQDMTGHAAAFMCWSSWCCQLNVLIPHVSNAAKLANAWPCQNLWNRRRTSHLQDHVVRNPNKHAALNFLSSSFAEICLFEGNVDFEREKCCHFEANPLKAHARLLNVAHKLFLNALTNLTTSLSCVLSTVAMWGPNHSSLLCFLLQLDSKEGSLLLRLWLNVCCFDFVFLQWRVDFCLLLLTHCCFVLLRQAGASIMTEEAMWQCSMCSSEHDDPCEFMLLTKCLAVCCHGQWQFFGNFFDIGCHVEEPRKFALSLRLQDDSCVTQNLPVFCVAQNQSVFAMKEEQKKSIPICFKATGLLRICVEEFALNQSLFAVCCRAGVVVSKCHASVFLLKSVAHSGPNATAAQCHQQQWPTPQGRASCAFNRI